MVRISAPLAWLASTAVVGAAAKTSIYLSPAKALDAAINVDAHQAHRILEHHMDVSRNAGEHVNQDAQGVWEHVLDAAQTLAGKLDHRTQVERLFDGHQDPHNRLLVLMHGTAHEDVIPVSVGATHSIEGAPSSASFDALFDGYLASVSRTLHSSESVLSHLAGTFLDGFSARLDWLTSHTGRATARWSQHGAAIGSAAFDKLEHELRAAEALVAKLEHSDVATDELAMQPLRFAALQEVESTYGSDSTELVRAKQWVAEAIDHVTQLFHSRSQQQGRVPSIAFVVTDSNDVAEAKLVKRSDSADTLLQPFLARTSELSHGAALRPSDLTAARKSKPSPLPKNLAGTCFGSQSKLEDATNSCSGHGKGVKTSRGGRPCWRCQCKRTEVRKGKKISWAGAACEKKDVSAEFMLLASSVLLLVLIAAGSVYFLYAQGSDELPGTLASVSISLK